MLLELVEGKPPNLNQPVDQVCFAILTLAAPDIDEIKWSPEMRDFLQICLVKDPYLRPGCDELMDHPFMLTENSPSNIENAREAFLKILLPFRETKKQN